MKSKRSLAFCSAILMASVASSASAFSLGGLFGSFFEPSGDDRIALVQKSVFDFDESITIGNALNHYSDCQAGSAKWSYFTTSRDENVVQFSCRLSSTKTYFDNYRKVYDWANQLVGGIEKIRKVSDLAALFPGGGNLGVLINALANGKDVETADLLLRFAFSKRDESKFSLKTAGILLMKNDGAYGVIRIDPGFVQNAIYADLPAFPYLDRAATYDFAFEMGGAFPKKAPESL